MRIGEVAKQANLRPSTLRYYEEIGLIRPPSRLNGQRVYEDDIFEVLTMIQLAQTAGFKLREIRQLLQDNDSDVALPIRWRRVAAEKLHEVEATIQHYQAIHQKLTISLMCECTSVDDCQLIA